RARLPAREHRRGGVGHQARRPPDPLGEACGVSRQEVETARQLPTTRALTAWCFETSRQPFHVAAAGLLVGLESQVPGIYKRNLPPLKSKYGFNEHEVEFFAIHIEADE